MGGIDGESGHLRGIALIVEEYPRGVFVACVGGAVGDEAAPRCGDVIGTERGENLQEHGIRPGGGLTEGNAGEIGTLQVCRHGEPGEAEECRRHINVKRLHVRVARYAQR